MSSPNNQTTGSAAAASGAEEGTTRSGSSVLTRASNGAALHFTLSPGEAENFLTFLQQQKARDGKKRSSNPLEMQEAFGDDDAEASTSSPPPTFFSNLRRETLAAAPQSRSSSIISPVSNAPPAAGDDDDDGTDAGGRDGSTTTKTPTGTSKDNIKCSPTGGHEEDQGIEKEKGEEQEKKELPAQPVELVAAESDNKRLAIAIQDLLKEVLARKKGRKKNEAEETKRPEALLVDSTLSPLPSSEQGGGSYGRSPKWSEGGTCSPIFGSDHEDVTGVGSPNSPIIGPPPPPTATTAKKKPSNGSPKESDRKGAKYPRRRSTPTTTGASSITGQEVLSMRAEKTEADEILRAMEGVIGRFLFPPPPTPGKTASQDDLRSPHSRKNSDSVSNRGGGEGGGGGLGGGSTTLSMSNDYGNSSASIIAQNILGLTSSFHFIDQDQESTGTSSDDDESNGRGGSDKDISDKKEELEKRKKRKKKKGEKKGSAFREFKDDLGPAGVRHHTPVDPDVEVVEQLEGYAQEELTSIAQFLLIFRRTIDNVIRDVKRTGIDKVSTTGAQQQATEHHQVLSIIELRKSHLNTAIARCSEFWDNLIPSVAVLEDWINEAECKLRDSNPFGFPFSNKSEASTTTTLHQGGGGGGQQPSGEQARKQSLPSIGNLGCVPTLNLEPAPTSPFGGMDVVGTGMENSATETCQDIWILTSSSVMRKFIQLVMTNTIQKQSETYLSDPETADAVLANSQTKRFWERLRAAAERCIQQGKLLRMCILSRRAQHMKLLRQYELDELDTLSIAYFEGVNGNNGTTSKEDEDSGGNTNPINNAFASSPDFGDFRVKKLAYATTHLQLGRLARLIGTCRALDPSGSELSLKRLSQQLAQMSTGGGSQLQHRQSISQQQQQPFSSGSISLLAPEAGAAATPVPTVASGGGAPSPMRRSLGIGGGKPPSTPSQGTLDVPGGGACGGGGGASPHAMTMSLGGSMLSPGGGGGGGGGSSLMAAAVVGAMQQQASSPSSVHQHRTSSGGNQLIPKLSESQLRSLPSASVISSFHGPGGGGGGGQGAAVEKVLAQNGPSFSVIPTSTLQELEMICRSYQVNIPTFAMPSSRKMQQLEAAFVKATAASRRMSGGSRRMSSASTMTMSCLMTPLIVQMSGMPTSSPTPSAAALPTLSPTPSTSRLRALARRGLRGKRDAASTAGPTMQNMFNIDSTDPRQQALFGERKCDVEVMTDNARKLTRDNGCQTSIAGNVVEQCCADNLMCELNFERKQLKVVQQDLLLEKAKNQLLLADVNARNKLDRIDLIKQTIDRDSEMAIAQQDQGLQKGGGGGVSITQRGRTSSVGNISAVTTSTTTKHSSAATEQSRRKTKRKKKVDEERMNTDEGSNTVKKHVTLEAEGQSELAGSKGDEMVGAKKKDKPDMDTTEDVVNMSGISSGIDDLVEEPPDTQHEYELARAKALKGLKRVLHATYGVHRGTSLNRQAVNEEVLAKTNASAEDVTILHGRIFTQFEQRRNERLDKERVRNMRDEVAEAVLQQHVDEEIRQQQLLAAKDQTTRLPTAEGDDDDDDDAVEEEEGAVLLGSEVSMPFTSDSVVNVRCDDGTEEGEAHQGKKKKKKDDDDDLLPRLPPPAPISVRFTNKKYRTILEKKLAAVNAMKNIVTIIEASPHSGIEDGGGDDDDEGEDGESNISTDGEERGIRKQHRGKNLQEQYLDGGKLAKTLIHEQQREEAPSSLRPSTTSPYRTRRSPTRGRSSSSAILDSSSSSAVVETATILVPIGVESRLVSQSHHMRTMTSSKQHNSVARSVSSGRSVPSRIFGAQQRQQDHGSSSAVSRPGSSTPLGALSSGSLPHSSKPKLWKKG